MFSRDVYGTSDPIEYFHHANELTRCGDFARAITHYDKAIVLDPNRLDAEVYVLAAWLLATCPDQQLRCAERAIRYASEGCALTEWCESWPLGVLAAAYAEQGEFEKAIEVQTKACSFASTIDQVDQARQLAQLKNGTVIPYRSLV